jgi:hypothetical protein
VRDDRFPCIQLNICKKPFVPLDESTALELGIGVEHLGSWELGVGSWELRLLLDL